MPAFTEEEMSLISTCNFESKNGLIDELTRLQGTLSPEEKHLASLISGRLFDICSVRTTMLIVTTVCAVSISILIKSNISSISPEPVIVAVSPSITIS